MRLIVGLGNPEDRYTGTRHNLGFEILDHYITHALPVEESDTFWSLNKKLKAEIGLFSGQRLAVSGQLIFAKPQTYMNNSGLAVKALANYYKVKPENIIIIHDELDLPLGQIKIRLGGAAAGHHGVESIIENLGTDKFIRLRLGIGNLKSQSGERGGNTFEAEKFVLSAFSQNDKSKIKHLQKRALLALKTLLDKGLDIAQNQYN